MAGRALNGLLGVALLGIVSLSPSAWGFCRTTTCDTKKERCDRDAKGCVTQGLPLYWPEKCLSFGVQESGSKLRGISYATAERVIQEAYRQWLAADCGGGKHPSFEVWDLGEPYGGIVCNQPEFNDLAPNANVWMFRDDGWPYTGGGSTLALTTITFEVPTGEILDADVEINSRSVALSTGADVENDLQSIATHETGHFLGLAHSNIKVATMNANYSPGDVSFRSLDRDDIAAICAVYPPDRDAQECDAPRPRHGFSRYCGHLVTNNNCAVAADSAPDRSGGGIAIGVAALALTGATSRWRRRRARRSG